MTQHERTVVPVQATTIPDIGRALFDHTNPTFHKPFIENLGRAINAMSEGTGSFYVLFNPALRQIEFSDPEAIIVPNEIERVVAAVYIDMDDGSIDQFKLESMSYLYDGLQEDGVRLDKPFSGAIIFARLTSSRTTDNRQAENIKLLIIEGMPRNDLWKTADEEDIDQEEREERLTSSGLLVRHMTIPMPQGV